MSNNSWTWITGSTSPWGIYGDKFVPDGSNVPGSREGAVGWLVGEEFWLFGGFGYDSYGGSGM